MRKLFIIGAIGLGLCGCSHHTYTNNSGTDNSLGTKHVAYGYSGESGRAAETGYRSTIGMMGDKPVNVNPDATAFRMSGDYARNVAVTLNHDGELTYFPAPSDITADSEPIQLSEGWWLNNQGLGPNSVFTRYTFAEYAALPQTPSPAQLKQAIIPGAKVTDFIQLPVKISEARSSIEEINSYLKGE